MTDPDLVHRLVLRDESTGAVSEAATFSVALPWQLRVDMPQPDGAVAGPAG